MEAAAIALLILGVVGIPIGFKYSESFITEIGAREIEFNYVVTLSIWTAALLVFFVLYALGEMVQLSYERTCMQYEALGVPEHFSVKKYAAQKVINKVYSKTGKVQITKQVRFPIKK